MAAEKALAQVGSYYQRGHLIVTIITDPGTQATTIQALSKPALLRALARAAVWEAIRNGNWSVMNPTDLATRVLFDSNQYAHLSVLKGLARQPYLRPDGSIMMMPGYDTATGMYGIFNPQDFSVPEYPTPAKTDARLSFVDTVSLLLKIGHTHVQKKPGKSMNSIHLHLHRSM